MQKPCANVNALSQVADYFKVLSEVSRIMVLCSLKSGQKSVKEIMEDTALGQANVSKHLKILKDAGFVIRKPEGVSAYYEIADEVIFELCELVCDRLSIRLQEKAQQSQELKALHQSVLVSKAS
jgi:DNA-binding transcriptional ArsR family regulator